MKAVLLTCVGLLFTSVVADIVRFETGEDALKCDLDNLM